MCAPGRNVSAWPVRDMTAAAGHAAAIEGTADMPYRKSEGAPDPFGSSNSLHHLADVLHLRRRGEAVAHPAWREDRRGVSLRGREARHHREVQVARSSEAGLGKTDRPEQRTGAPAAPVFVWIRGLNGAALTLTCAGGGDCAPRGEQTMTTQARTASKTKTERDIRNEQMSTFPAEPGWLLCSLAWLPSVKKQEES
jgi:hypothetical protein